MEHMIPYTISPSLREALENTQSLKGEGDPSLDPDFPLQLDELLAVLDVPDSGDEVVAFITAGTWDVLQAINNHRREKSSSEEFIPDLDMRELYSLKRACLQVPPRIPAQPIRRSKIPVNPNSIK